MTAERDIAGFALPFATGITTAVYMCTSRIMATGHITAVLLAAVMAGVLCMMHPVHRSMNAATLRCIITATALCCGLLTGISGTMKAISDTAPCSPISHLATDFRQSLCALTDSIPFKCGETNAIIKALITGDRSSLSRQCISAFRDSGASHILALSGLHLGIIYGLLSRLLSFIGNSPTAKVIRSLLTVSSCGFYAIATGAGASITRALLFIIIAEAARLSGRYRNTAGTLMSALMIQLLIDPTSTESIGFQLSYAAMAGIAFIYPRLKGFWPESGKAWMRPMSWIWNSAAMSISCQLTTGPLAYIHFGTFPQYFLITNLIALPLTGLVIPISLL